MISKNYTIIKDAASLALLEAHIDNFSYFAYDVEATGLNVRKDKVIGYSICGQTGTAFYFPILTWDKTFHCLRPINQHSDFIRVLNKLKQRELLMWNGSYDCRITLNNLGVDLVPVLLADVMLMKHTVCEDGDFRLKETAIELAAELGLGDQETAANEEQLALKANVIANGGIWLKNNKEMYKADLEVMGPYACADADLTFRIAEHYKTKLEQEGLEEFFYDIEVMPLYREVTIPMEANGVKLDLPLIEQTKIDIEVDMAELQKAILDDLNAIPEVQQWLRRRAAEEFPPKASGQFAQAVCERFNLELPKTPAGKFSLGAKFLEKLPESAAKHFLQGQAELNAGDSQEISWNLFVKSGQDQVNISSKKQMGEIAFGCLGIKPLGKTPTGLPQFDDTMIEHLAEIHKLNWAEKLSSYNKLSKIRGTYIDRFLDAHEDGYYFFSYKQHGTVSGRYSGDAQQLPRPKEEEELAAIVLKYNNLVRSFFICREGRSFIDDDYESLEPHVFAHISGDEGLRDIFRKGHDFYSSIAIPTENLQGVSADKKAENYLGKVNKPVRQSAKAYALGVPYGMTGFALGKSLNISTKEAEKKIEGYLGGFPALANWMEESQQFVKAHGYIRTESGRIRHLPKVKELFKKHDDQLLDWRYRNSLIQQYSRKMGKEEATKVVKGMQLDYKNGLNNGINVQVQGMGGSIINRACIAITREFRRRNIDGYICGQFHDQAIFDVPEDRVEECKVIVQDLMENTTKLSVSLKAVPVVSKNWKDGH